VAKASTICIAAISIIAGVITFTFANGNMALVLYSLRADLHYGNYRSMLGHFEAQKIFSMFKKALA